MNKVITCPQCKKKHEVEKAKENGYFPFCCLLCKNLDLYKWLNEEYFITEKNPHTDEGN